jgi:predicted O-methyltransferase YrrM
VTTADDPSFDAALHSITGVEGWMTDAQARRLWDCARAVDPGGRIVEIGSFHGRSAIVLARAADSGVEVVAIDPHAGNDRGPQELQGSADNGERDYQTFLTNLDRAQVSDRVRHIRLASQDAIGEVEAPIDLLYIDGAHRYRPARDDIRSWGARLSGGGTMLIHDSFCSVGVTAAIMTDLLTCRRLSFIGRVGSLAEYRHHQMSRGERWRSMLRQVAQLPWFVRSLIVKVLLVLHLRPLTRLFGQRDGEWPY